MGPIDILLHSKQEYTLQEYAEKFDKHWRRGKLFKAMRQYGFACVYCGDPAYQVRRYTSPPEDKIYTGVVTKSYERMTLDHIVPKSMGGSNRIANTAPACLPCNSKKADQINWEWLKAHNIDWKDLK